MKIAYWLLFAVAATISGCSSDSRERPPRTTIRIFNAAPNYESIIFVREQRGESQLAFSNGVTGGFDSGPYDFSLQYQRADMAESSIAGQISANLSPNNLNLFVHVVENGVLRNLLFTIESREASETTSRYFFVHAHPDLQNLDVYMVPADTVTDCLVSGQALRGSASYTSTPVEFDLPQGTYRLCLTAAGDPDTVVYQSSDLSLPTTGRDVALIVYDATGINVAGLQVSLFESSAAVLAQANVNAKVRVLQAVDDGLDREVLRNDETTPLFPAPLVHGVVSDYVDLVLGDNDIKLFTPGAGDPEATQPIFPGAARFITVFFAGDTTNGVVSSALIEDTRRIVGQAKVRYIHAAGMHDDIEIFLRSPGTDISNAFPDVTFLTAPGLSQGLAYPPREYEITIRDLDTQTVLLGPNPVTLEESGVYGFVVLNDPVDPAKVVIEHLYDEPL